MANAEQILGDAFWKPLEWTAISKAEIIELQLKCQHEKLGYIRVFTVNLDAKKAKAIGMRLVTVSSEASQSP